MRKIFFTFDVEDFTNEKSIIALQAIIELLNRYNFKGIFFLTGHMTEKLQNYPKIIDLLEEHEIGYHSSGHSVHPTIFEFTDVERYKEAYETSLIRETSHINPLTGEIGGKGGILVLRKLFSSKKIVAYRAPGYCWSPPHTEALRDLGLKFDFSSDISKVPVHYKGLNFYSYPILARWDGTLSDFRFFWITLARKQYVIIGLHPSLLVTHEGWDRIYHNGNPKLIIPPKPLSFDEIKRLFRSFDLFLKQIKLLEKFEFLEVTTNLTEGRKDLIVKKDTAEMCYKQSMRWAKNIFHYKPRFLRNHFFRFFNTPFHKQTKSITKLVNFIRSPVHEDKGN